MRALLARMLLFAVLLGLGAAPLHAPRPSDPGLAAFLAAGGSLADICGDRHGDPAHPGPDCAACLPPLLALGPAPGGAPAAARQRPSPLRFLRRPGPPAPRRRRRPGTGGPRAPPAA